MCVSLPCGYSSQTLAKIIAYADIVLAFLTLTSLAILWGLTCGSLVGSGQVLFSETTSKYYSALITCDFILETHNGALKGLLISLGVFYSVGMLILAFILLYGAHERNLTAISRWIQISLYVGIIRFLLCILWIIFSPPSPSESRIAALFFTIINLFYNTMTGGMIYKFHQQLAQEKWRGKRYNYRYYY